MKSRLLPFQQVHFRIAIILIALLTLQSFTNRLNAGTPVGTFTVVSHGSVTDTRPYETAIANADMEQFRYQNQRCTITFDNGVKIELLSATEMQQAGHNITISDYKYSDTPGWTQPTFHLNADGTLSALYTKSNSKQSTQVNH
jgi:hypothetical protein